MVWNVFIVYIIINSLSSDLSLLAPMLNPDCRALTCVWPSASVPSPFQRYGGRGGRWTAWSERPGRWRRQTNCCRPPSSLRPCTWRKGWAPEAAGNYRPDEPETMWANQFHLRLKDLNYKNLVINAEKMSCEATFEVKRSRDIKSV